MMRSGTGTIHRDGCGHAGRARHWDWADSYDDELVFFADLARYPWLRLCQYCFTHTRPAVVLARTWAKGMGAVPLKTDGNRRVCHVCFDFTCDHGRRVACPVPGCECTTVQRVS